MGVAHICLHWLESDVIPGGLTRFSESSRLLTKRPSLIHLVSLRETAWQGGFSMPEFLTALPGANSWSPLPAVIWLPVQICDSRQRIDIGHCAEHPIFQPEPHCNFMALAADTPLPASKHLIDELFRVAMGACPCAD